MNQRIGPSDAVDLVFPLGTPEEGDEELQMRLGYPDLTLGEATEALSQLPEHDLKILQRFAPEFFSNLINVSEYLLGLTRGYHVRDPNRRGVASRDIVLDELRAAEDYVGLFDDYERLPMLEWDYTYEGHVSTGAEIKGWYMMNVISTEGFERVKRDTEKKISLMRSVVLNPDLSDPDQRFIMLGMEREKELI